MVRIEVNDGTIKVCYKCFTKIAIELRETSPTVYKGRIIKITKAESCELCNKLNIIKI